MEAAMDHHNKKKVSIPDNLDLAAMAKLGLNGLMGTCDPDRYFEPYLLTCFAAKPPYLLHWSSQQSGVQPKFMEALALLKCITGSPDTGLEKAFIKAMMENAEEDGFIYDRKDPKRPWNVGFGYGGEGDDLDYANIAGNGRWANAMWYMYQLTGDDTYKKALRRCAEKLQEVAVYKDDYAFYPDSKTGNDFSWIKAGWPHKNEPMGPREGSEASTTFYQALAARGLMKWYFVSGDERMLALSGRLVRFVMKPKFYGGLAAVDPDYSAERAHFWGHTHGNLAAFRGIMDYAITANDMQAKEFVRDAYEWLRQNMCPQLGQHVCFEGCATADWPALAIQLTDAGMGDYWDDVDHAIRNATAQAQATDIEALRKIVERYDGHKYAFNDIRHWYSVGWGREIPGLMYDGDDVLERCIGAFPNNLIEGRYQSSYLMSCCTGNGNQGFYYAWEAAIRHSDGVSTVNLFFTRFSEWMDLISYLPYEGKVVIKNKTSKTINIRIPGNVLLNQVEVSISGNPGSLSYSGRYLNLTGLSGNEEIIVTFPQYKRTQTLSIPDLNGTVFRGYPKVTATFVGSTCIGLEDGGPSILGSDHVWVKQFNEPKYLNKETLYKDAPYYVPPKVIKWY